MRVASYAWAVASSLATMACGGDDGQLVPATDASTDASMPRDAREDTLDVRDASLDASLDAPAVGDTGVDGGGVDAGSPCGAGASLIEAELSCPGAPPAPPGSFAAAAASGVRGDVVSLGGLDEPSAPCLPVYVCAPDDAATMLFSDEPESPKADGVLYADTLAPGRVYRVYVYHANGGATPRKFPVVVLNQGVADAHATVVRKGLAGPTTSYVAAGKAAIHGWLATAAPSTVTVPAGTRVLLDADLDALHANTNELVHAIFDVTVDAPLKLSVVTLPPSADATTATAGLSLLPNSKAHTRGTFPSADRWLVLAVPVDASGVRRLVLGGNVVDKDLAGTSAVDGFAVTLGGNYGVTYRVRASLATHAALAVTARGGTWGAAAQLPAGEDGASSVTLLPSAVEALDPTTKAVLLGRFAAGANIELVMVSGGGSSLPVDLLSVPLK